MHRYETPSIPSYTFYVSLTISVQKRKEEHLGNSQATRVPGCDGIAQHNQTLQSTQSGTTFGCLGHPSGEPDDVLAREGRVRDW
jgi:hypothetical protein